MYIVYCQLGVGDPQNTYWHQQLHKSLNNKIICFFIKYPKRGLLQGNPLFPFVLILCTEAFVSLFVKVRKTYGKASGEYINFEKSSLPFGKKIS